MHAGVSQPTCVVLAGTAVSVRSADTCAVRAMGLDFFFFQAEDGIRYLVRSRGLGDVYKRQDLSKVEPSVAGPKRPQDRVALAAVAQSFQAAAEGLSLIHI